VRIGAVILAGGEGRRIGGNKPLKPLAGRPLFEHVLRQVRNWQLPCAVAVRDIAHAGFAEGLPLLPDLEAIGPLAGLASALRHGREHHYDAMLTLPCDTPLLPDDLPEKLEAALLPPAGAAVAQSAGRIHPSCALWHVGAADALRGYVPHGRSLIGFAEQVGAVMVDWPAEPYDPFFNVNTEADLAVAEELIRSR
jgi:molybdopterin-guanine dinucleotide biosynthesis protein A